MAERVAVRDITNEEGNKLLQIVRRGSGCGDGCGAVSPGAKAFLKKLKKR